MMRNGYILKDTSCSSCYFQSFVKGKHVTTGDKNHAWFAESLTAASLMLIDLFQKLGCEDRNDFNYVIVAQSFETL